MNSITSWTFLLTIGAFLVQPLCAQVQTVRSTPKASAGPIQIPAPEKIESSAIYELSSALPVSTRDAPLDSIENDAQITLRTYRPSDESEVLRVVNHQQKQTIAGFDPGSAGASSGSSKSNNSVSHIAKFGTLSPVNNPFLPPWRKNVLMASEYPSGKIGFCSGGIIGDEWVLTAGHCIYDRSANEFADRVTVYPGFNRGDTPYGSARAIELTVIESWRVAPESNPIFDIGWVQLDRPVGVLTGTYGFGFNDDDEFFKETQFENPGYPLSKEFPDGVMHTWKGVYDTTDTYFLFQDNSGSGGQSGSVAYRESGGNEIIHGVLSFRYEKLNEKERKGTAYTRISSPLFAETQAIKEERRSSELDLVVLDVEGNILLNDGELVEDLEYLVYNRSSQQRQGTWTSHVYLSSDDIITMDDQLLGTHEFEWNFQSQGLVSVNAGQSVAIPENLSGTYYIGVVLDFEDAVMQNNVSNGWDAHEVRVIDSPGQVVIGELRDVQLSERGGLEELAAQNVDVELFQGGVLQQMIQSDDRGIFQFSGLSPGTSYDLRITATKKLETGSKEVQFVRTLKGVQPGGIEEIVVPISLFVQASSLVAELENLTIPSDFLSSVFPNVSLLRSYDMEGTRELLVQWNGTESALFDEITEAMARMLIVEQVIDSQFQNAVLMSHESGKNWFEMVKLLLSFRTTIETMLTVPGVDVFYEKLNGLVLLGVLKGPITAVAAILPDPYSSALSAGIEELIDTATKEAHKPGTTFFKNLLTNELLDLAVLLFDQQILSYSYVPYTQPNLDKSNVMTQRLDYSQSLFLANYKAKDIVDQSTAFTKEAARLSEESRLIAEYTELVGDMSAIVGLHPSWRAFMSVSFLVKGLAAGHLVQAAMLTDQRLADLEFETEVATTWAFHPPVSKNGSMFPSSDFRQKSKRIDYAVYDAQQVQKYQNALKTASNHYLEVLAETMDYVRTDQRNQVANNIEALLELDSAYNEALLAAQAPAWATAETASQQQLAGFGEQYVDMTVSASQSALERVVLYGRLLGYLNEEPLQQDSLLVQADTVATAFNEVSEDIAATTELVAGISAPPLLVISSQELNAEPVNIGSNFQITAVLKNLGATEADSINVDLIPDSTAIVVGSSRIEVDHLGADGEIALQWDLKQIVGTKSLGNYLIAVASSNARDLSSSGLYAINLDVVTKSTEEPEVVTQIDIAQNYPNPFQDQTTLSFSIPKATHVRLVVFDTLGREIEVLVDDMLEAGTHQVTFDGSKLPPGVYAYRLSTDTSRITKMMTLIL